jgi:hypothetical protein
MSTLLGKDHRRMQIIVAVVVVILAVAMPYLLTLYFSNHLPQPYGLHRTRIDFGIEWAFTKTEAGVTWMWDDIELDLELVHGNGSLAWFPASEVLTNTSGGQSRQFFTYQALQSVLVWCNVTDLKGNGQVDVGDYFTFTTGSSHRFSSETNYTLLVFNRLDGNIIRQDTFTG